MNKNISLLCVLLVVLFTSCSKGRKLMIMASGKIVINGNNVSLEPGTQHNEITIDASNPINVESPGGKMELNLKDEGFYLLNLKKDTLVGSFQRTGTDNSQIVITQDDMFQKIDSLDKLVKGQNVSEAARNYNIAPYGISKLTKNTDAEVIGPYRKIPASFDPSRQHEVYKFYTTKEVMEIIEKAKKSLSGQ